MDSTGHKHTYLVYIVLALFLSGVILPGFARKKPKGKPQTAERAHSRLPYADQQRFDYFFLEAVKHYNAGRHAAAIDLFRHCEQIDSNASAPDYYLARYYTAMKQDSLLFLYGNRALRKEPDNKTYLQLMADAYLGAKDIDKATELYERLYSLDKANDEVIGLLANIYQHQANYTMMLDALNRQELVEGPSEEITLSKMYAYDQLKQPKKALAELRNLSAAYPYDYRYKVMTANWLFQNHRQAEALKLLDEVLREEPNNLDALASYYDYYRDVKDEEHAREKMMRLLLHPDTDADQRVRLFQAAYQWYEVEAKDSVMMLKLLNDVLQAAPRNVDIAEMKESYFLVKGMPQDSIDAMRRYILDIEPDNMGARYRYITSLADQERHDEVLTVAQAGIDYYPTDPMFYYFKIATLFILKDYKQAVEVTENAMPKLDFTDRDGLRSQFYEMLGDAYNKLDDTEKMFEAYEQSLKYDPENIGCLNNYAYNLSLERRELDKAEQMSRKTIEKEPENGNYEDTYAWIQFMKENYPEAKVHIDKALVLFGLLAGDSDSVAVAVVDTLTLAADTLATDTVAVADEQSLHADILDHAGDIYLMVEEAEKALEFWKMAQERGCENAMLPEKIELLIKQLKKEK